MVSLDEFSTKCRSYRSLNPRGGATLQMPLLAELESLWWRDSTKMPLLAELRAGFIGKINHEKWSASP